MRGRYQIAESLSAGRPVLVRQRLVKDLTWLASARSRAHILARETASDVVRLADTT